MAAKAPPPVSGPPDIEIQLPSGYVKIAMENGPFREEKRFYNRGFSIVMLNFWGVLPTNCYTARNDFLIGWFETNSWLLLRMTRFWGTLQH